MNRLPGLATANTTCQLFVTDDTAARIATLFVDPTPVAVSQFATALAGDPALSLWIQCAAAGEVLDRFQLMATWFGNHARRRFAEAISESSSITPDEVPLRARAAQLTARSTAAAALIANAHDADRLVALLHNADQWLAWAGARPAIPSSLELLPAWLAQRIESAAPRDPADDKSNEHQTRAHAAWTGTPRLPLPLFELAARMDRLHQLENEFHRQLELEKLEALAEFSAGAGHEINNPLAVISGRAQLLLEDEEHPERRRDLATIHGQARRVHEMILDIMLFGRPPAPRKSWIDLADVIAAVVAEAHPRAVEQKVDLCWSRGPSPLGVQGDAAQLSAALKVLIDNGLNATSAGGRIEIAATHGSSEASLGSDAIASAVLVTVIDTGTGIPADVRRHLFDPYFSGRAAGRGLGLGLSKCWRIITNHGGTIRVESEPGHGSRFTIGLPGEAPPG